MTSMQQALLLIDLQNDFCPGGALAVREGDQVMAVANQYAAEFSQRGLPVVATQDWHPANHGSFASTAGEAAGSCGMLAGQPQIWWPDHCIQNSTGAALHPSLTEQYITHRVRKGQNPEVDSYSAFYDNGHLEQTGLNDWLKARNITALTVMGLATDYCVRYSVLDGLALGYAVTVIRAGCRGVELKPGDCQAALDEMAARGAVIV